MKLFNLKTLSAAALLASASGMASAYDMTVANIKSDVDWTKVPTTEKTFFFPGEITYDWINSEAHGGFNKPHFATKTCTDCHAGEEKGLGDMLLKGDAMTHGDKPGTIDANLQFAHDDEYLYVRADWATEAPYPARTHNLFQINNGKWSERGKDRMRNPYSAAYEDRFTLMIDDGSVDQFAQQGCWMTCHRGMRDIGQAYAPDVQALPVIGKSGLNKKDVRKYLPDTRTDRLGLNWSKLKTQEEIDQLKADGKFVDLMQWRSTRSAPTGAADDGYVLEYRNNDKGKTVFTWNMNKKTGQPKYMFDKSVTGFYALNKADINDLSKQIALVEGVNTMPYDAAMIEDGQFMQGRYNRVANGSAGDNTGIEASWKDGRYTIVFKRKLNTGHADDKVMTAGKTYDFNVGIHDGQSTTRFHHVTFPFTVGIGENAEGDVVSTSVK